ncbi:helix-turn-helix domain-containing protein [Alkalihalophilus marmarensis]|jgi:DNA-binding PucR family transcriptional regulator|uniref:Transcriptional regulator n=1 Tax=Alkalihalophilus marmarensis DSM 21297 TaxID=1188261 RepID=U6SL73_9BACI|nr:helix-turn-helix domain-containing protein [Alkalihalophilus marmarensis]ERN51366.1 transcriptional regulator [Alkalihalophilus marmarensis DSM 21297]MCM3490419.1 helix-turn-helix domain-containing protein [Alkalihalophilus marmarensis]
MSDNKLKSFNRQFDSLEEFVDAISERLQCPVTIEDSNHHLLAYSSHDDGTDAARISTIIGRRVPEKVINRFWKEGVIPTLNQSDEPLIIPQINDIGLGNRVAVSIRKNNEVLGYIWVLEVGRKLTADDLADLKFAASKAKNQLLQLNMQKKKKEKNHQELLWQLITGDARDHKHIADQLSKIGINPTKPLAVILFNFEVMSDDLYKKLVYVAKTTQKVTILIQTLDENQVVFLVSSPASNDFVKDTKEFVETFKAQVRERFGIMEVTAGCGYAYDNYEWIKRSYDEATKVITLKQTFTKELQSAAFYHELGVFRYIDLIRQTIKEQEMTVNPAIRKLEKYDLEHRTNLLETLGIILDKDGNMNEAAKELHCHVNTLNYRLKRIQEIANIQLKDPVQKIGLYLDMKVYLKR